MTPSFCFAPYFILCLCFYQPAPYLQLILGYIVFYHPILTLSIRVFEGVLVPEIS